VNRLRPGILSLVFAVVIFDMPKAGDVFLVELLGAVVMLPGLVRVFNGRACMGGCWFRRAIDRFGALCRSITFGVMGIYPFIAAAPVVVNRPEKRECLSIK
jgi:hypothetical protein